jgi:3-oxoacyl-[acyl-carrier protein] reductase
MELSDHIALVTGAGSGIGKATALELAKSGARVVVTDINLSAASSVMEEIKAGGGSALSYAADVSLRSQVKEVTAAVTKEWGKVDVLVNNAGFGQYKAFETLTEDDWDRMLNVHLKGAFNCTQAVLEHMKPAKWGRIINMASVAGMTGTPTHCHYSAAKGGLIGLTKALARELAAHNITVNAVAPGLTDTPFIKAVKPELQQAVIDRTPMRRPATPQEVAWTCCFLASDKAGYITGQVLSPNGGFLM